MASDPQWRAIYQARRAALRARLGDQTIFLLGAMPQPRNYPHNVFPFRQNSHVLYYSGLSEPNIHVLMLPDGDDLLVMDPVSLEDIVWTGPVPSPEELAADAGLSGALSLAELARRAADDPELMSSVPHQVNDTENSSPELREAIIAQRNIKSADEIAEIENALAVTAHMHAVARELCEPGITEAIIAGAMQGIALQANRAQAYNPICTVRGEVLHNNGYTNVLEAGQILLIDAAAESPRFYASDITRDLAVSGQFTAQQQAIYDLVLNAQLTAIAAIQPGRPYREIHDISARVIAAGLIDLGLMAGDPHEAVAAGAHACFYPHGLGHLLGLDVHDMEDLGEDYVGYLPSQERSEQFGTAYLRCARPLEVGMVVTVEPGCYFNPTLIDLWQAEGKFREFINYDKLDPFRTFGGIRIEDDIVVTESGARVLGPGIPK